MVCRVVFLIQVQRGVSLERWCGVLENTTNRAKVEDT